MRVRFLLGETWIGLRRNLSMTFAVVLTVALSVTLLGIALMVRAGVHELEDRLVNTINVEVYLDAPCSATNTGSCITPSQQTQIQTTLNALPEVSSTQYISQQQAYELFKKQNANNQTLIKLVSPDELPASFLVKLKSPNPQSYAIVSDAVSGLQGVKNVSNGQAVIQKVFDVLDRLTRGIYLSVVLLFAAAALLIWNMARIAVFSRRREIGIMRLVGAGDLSIQAPFILEGFAMGIVGTLVGLALVVLSKAFIINHIAISVFAAFSDSSVLTAAIWPVVLVGILVTTVITGLTLQRHLRV